MGRNKRPSYVLFESSYGRGKKPLGLYIHVPFCEKKCDYCDFISYDDKPHLEKRYVEAVLRLITTYAKSMADYEIDTVYVGGGTPTLLKTGSLKKILHAVKAKLPLRPDAEVTVEANPASGVYRKLKKLRSCGVNRLSVGVQSLCDSELKTLGRIHTAEEAKETLAAAKKAGFSNVSADVIYAIPGQTPGSFEKTLAELLSFDLQHVSAYSLKVEEGTRLYKVRDTLAFPSEGEDRGMYHRAAALLSEKGFARYEISNFCRPGFESRHNLKYWNLREYLGLGPGAHSYFLNRRFSMVGDLEEFLSCVEGGRSLTGPDSELTPILPSERLGEYVMTRLRLSEGVVERDFVSVFQREFSEVFGDKIPPLVEGGFLERAKGRVYLTPKGIDVCNSVLCELLELENLQ